MLLLPLVFTRRRSTSVVIAFRAGVLVAKTKMGC
ncbi:hypothetical protein REJC140_04167 [Pseudorhizobium endolithicum]|uniref:Uncharacterized protein n=1 Tax=Pseudorhizobium endolithicum TaxID=1191678 RepID=A0ABN7JTD7_9HYPH|nr:hypothetical protein REJC140_04167 [Pseudorhizobium endolithicum]